jgi:hypothetical protein
MDFPMGSIANPDDPSLTNTYTVKFVHSGVVVDNYVNNSACTVNFNSGNQTLTVTGTGVQVNAALSGLLDIQTSANSGTLTINVTVDDVTESQTNLDTGVFTCDVLPSQAVYTAAANYTNLWTNQPTQIPMGSIADADDGVYGTKTYTLTLVGDGNIDTVTKTGGTATFNWDEPTQTITLSGTRTVINNALSSYLEFTSTTVETCTFTGTLDDTTFGMNVVSVDSMDITTPQSELVLTDALHGQSIFVGFSGRISNGTISDVNTAGIVDKQYDITIVFSGTSVANAVETTGISIFNFDFGTQTITATGDISEINDLLDFGISATCNVLGTINVSIDVGDNSLAQPSIDSDAYTIECESLPTSQVVWTPATPSLKRWEVDTTTWGSISDVDDTGTKLYRVELAFPNNSNDLTIVDNSTATVTEEANNVIRILGTLSQVNNALAGNVDFTYDSNAVSPLSIGVTVDDIDYYADDHINTTINLATTASSLATITDDTLTDILAGTEYDSGIEIVDTTSVDNEGNEKTYTVSIGTISGVTNVYLGGDDSYFTAGANSLSVTGTKGFINNLFTLLSVDSSNDGTNIDGFTENLEDVTFGVASADTFTFLTTVYQPLAVTDIVRDSGGSCYFEVGGTCQSTAVYSAVVTGTTYNYQWSVDPALTIIGSSTSATVEIQSNDSNSNDTYNVTCEISNPAQTVDRTEQFVHSKVEGIEIIDIVEDSGGFCAYTGAAGTCSASTTFSANIIQDVGTISYTWSILSGDGTISGSNTNSTVVVDTPNDQVTSTYTLQLVVSDDNTTHTHSEVMNIEKYRELEVNDITVSDVDSLVCYYPTAGGCSTSSTFSVSTQYGFGSKSYLWSVDAPMTISGSNTDPSLVVVSPNNSTDYNFNVTCQVTDLTTTDSTFVNFDSTKELTFWEAEASKSLTLTNGSSTAWIGYNSGYLYEYSTNNGATWNLTTSLAATNGQYGNGYWIGHKTAVGLGYSTTPSVYRTNNTFSSTGTVVVVTKTNPHAVAGLCTDGAGTWMAVVQQDSFYGQPTPRPYISSDDGATWQSCGASIVSTNNGYAFDAFYNNGAWYVTYTTGTGVNKIKRTTNLVPIATSWTDVTPTMVNFDWDSTNIMTGNSSTLVLAAKNSDYILKSTDNGVSFSEVQLPFTIINHGSPFIAANASGNWIAAASDNTFMYSDDDMVTWYRAPDSLSTDNTTGYLGRGLIWDGSDWGASIIRLSDSQGFIRSNNNTVPK